MYRTHHRDSVLPMSVTRIQALRCDHRPTPNGRRPAAAGLCTHAFIPDAVDLVLPRVRELAARVGWDRYITGSRHEYDLCPDHNGQRPGVDFPHWKAGEQRAAAGAAR
jgi:hypothetical protein